MVKSKLLDSHELVEFGPESVQLGHSVILR